MFRPTSAARFLSFSALAFLTLIGFLTFFTHHFQSKNIPLFELSLNTGQWIFSADTAGLLTRSACEYLQKTADILGAQSDPEFYQSAIQTGFENLTLLPERIKEETESVSKSESLFKLFDSGSFEEDSALQETLTFLNDLEPAPDAKTFFQIPVNLAGNPLDGIGAALAEPFPLSRQFFEMANRYTPRALTFSELCGTLFSLLSVTVSLLTPESRLLALLGIGAIPFDYFFFVLTQPVFLFFLRIIPQIKPHLFSAYTFSQLIFDPQIEERKKIVLIR